jgi:hypothetical protein
MLEKIVNKKYIYREFNRNNFHHWKFSKFWVEFKLKIKEALGFKIQ